MVPYYPGPQARVTLPAELGGSSSLPSPSPMREELPAAAIRNTSSDLNNATSTGSSNTQRRVMEREKERLVTQHGGGSAVQPSSGDATTEVQAHRELERENTQL